MQSSCQIPPGTLNHSTMSAGTAQRCQTCGTRLAFVQSRPVGRCNKEPPRHARTDGRGIFRQQRPSYAAGAQNAALSVRSPAARADAITTEKASDLVPGGREFFQWIVDLPWNRLAVWVAIAWFAYQLKDFFGVSGNNTLPAPPSQCPCC